MYKLGIIGLGKMGSSILSGIIKSSIYNKNEILLFDINENIKTTLLNDGFLFSDNEEQLLENVESDIFMNGLINCVAYMVWPYLNVSPKMEVYSNHDPAWIIAYSLPIWIRGFIDYDGMWDARELKSQVDSFLHFKYSYIPIDRKSVV